MNLSFLDSYLPFVSLNGVPFYSQSNYEINLDSIFIDKRIFNTGAWDYVRSSKSDFSLMNLRFLESFGGGVEYCVIEPLKLVFPVCNVLYYNYLVLALIDKTRDDLVSYFNFDKKVYADVRVLRYDLVYKSLVEDGGYYYLDYFGNDFRVKVEDSYLLDMLKGGVGYNNRRHSYIFDSVKIMSKSSSYTKGVSNKVVLSDEVTLNVYDYSKGSDIFSYLFNKFVSYKYDEGSEFDYDSFVDKYSFFSSNYLSVIPLLIGLSGVSKSAVVKKLAEALNLEFIDVKLSFYDRFDITGLYHVEVTESDLGSIKTTHQGLMDVFIRASDEYLFYARKMFLKLKQIKNEYVDFVELGKIEAIPDAYKKFFAKEGGVYFIDALIDKFRKESRPCLIFFDEFYRISADVLDQLINLISQRRLLGKLNYKRAVIVGAANDILGLFNPGESKGEDIGDYGQSSMFSKLMEIYSSEYAKRFEIIVMTPKVCSDTFKNYLERQRKIIDKVKAKYTEGDLVNVSALEEELSKFDISDLVIEFLLYLYNKNEGDFNVFYGLDALKEKLKSDEEYDFSHVTFRSWEFVSRALNYFKSKWRVDLGETLMVKYLGKAVSSGYLYSKGFIKYILPKYKDVYLDELFNFLSERNFFAIEDLKGKNFKDFLSKVDFIPSFYEDDKLKFYLYLGYESSVPVMMFGPTALGKCVGGDTYVTLDGKVMLIDDFVRKEFGGKVVEGFSDIRGLSIESFDLYSSKTYSFYHKNSECRRIYFDNGGYLVCTYNHPLAVWFSDGDIGYTSYICVGDKVLFKKLYLDKLVFKGDYFVRGVYDVCKDEGVFNNIDFLDYLMSLSSSRMLEFVNRVKLDGVNLVDEIYEFDYNSVFSYVLGLLVSSKYFGIELDIFKLQLFNHLGLYVNVSGYDYTLKFLLDVFDGVSSSFICDREVVKFSYGNFNEVEFYVFKVVKVEDVGVCSTYDFSVDGVHSFISNGCLSHNTTRVEDISKEKACEFLKVELTTFSPGDVTGYPMISDVFMLGFDSVARGYLKSFDEYNSFIGSFRDVSNEVFSDLLSWSKGKKGSMLSFPDVKFYTKKYVLNTIYDKIAEFLRKRRDNPGIKLILFFDEVNRIPLGGESLLSVVFEAISDNRILGYDLEVGKGDIFVVCAGNIPVKGGEVFSYYEKFKDKFPFLKDVKGYVDFDRFGYNARGIDSALSNRGLVMFKYNYDISDLKGFRYYVENSGVYDDLVVKFVKSLTDEEVFFILFSTEFSYTIDEGAVRFPHVRSFRDLSVNLKLFKSDLRSHYFSTIGLDFSKFSVLGFSGNLYTILFSKFEATFIGKKLKLSEEVLKDKNKVFFALLIIEFYYSFYMWLRSNMSNYVFKDLYVLGKKLFESGVSEDLLLKYKYLEVYFSDNVSYDDFAKDFYLFMKVFGLFEDVKGLSLKGIEELSTFISGLIDFDDYEVYFDKVDRGVLEKVLQVMMEGEFNRVVKEFGSFNDFVVGMFNVVGTLKNVEMDYISGRYRVIVDSFVRVSDVSSGEEVISRLLTSISEKLNLTLLEGVREVVSEGVSLVDVNNLYLLLVGYYDKSKSIYEFSNYVKILIDRFEEEKSYSNIGKVVGLSLCVLLNKGESVVNCDGFFEFLYKSSGGILLARDSVLSLSNKEIVSLLFEYIKESRIEDLKKFL